MSAQPVLKIVICSTRPGRVGPAVATWFEELARQNASFVVEMVDLAEVNLPLLDEPNHPMRRQYTHDHTLKWSATVSGADAFVFVMPEYNHSFNAATKNAIDYLFHEWAHKPVGFVGYGGASGGMRAVEALKPSIMALKMIPTQLAVNVHHVHKHHQPDGGFLADDSLVAAANGMLAELLTWTNAMATIRQT